MRPATSSKKRIWLRCFPVNFAKFLRTLFLQNTSDVCFCKTWFSPDLTKGRIISKYFFVNISFHNMVASHLCMYSFNPEGKPEPFLVDLSISIRAFPEGGIAWSCSFRFRPFSVGLNLVLSVESCTLRTKCPNTGYFWSVICCIRIEYGDLIRTP